MHRTRRLDLLAVDEHRVGQRHIVKTPHHHDAGFGEPIREVELPSRVARHAQHLDIARWIADVRRWRQHRVERQNLGRLLRIDGLRGDSESLPEIAGRRVQRVVVALRERRLQAAIRDRLRLEQRVESQRLARRPVLKRDQRPAIRHLTRLTARHRLAVRGQRRKRIAHRPDMEELHIAQRAGEGVHELSLDRDRGRARRTVDRHLDRHGRAGEQSPLRIHRAKPAPLEVDRCGARRNLERRRGVERHAIALAARESLCIRGERAPRLELVANARVALRVERDLDGAVAGREEREPARRAPVLDLVEIRFALRRLDHVEHGHVLDARRTPGERPADQEDSHAEDRGNRDIAHPRPALALHRLERRETDRAREEPVQREHRRRGKHADGRLPGETDLARDRASDVDATRVAARHRARLRLERVELRAARRIRAQPDHAVPEDIDLRQNRVLQRSARELIDIEAEHRDAAESERSAHADHKSIGASFGNHGRPVRIAPRGNGDERTPAAR